MQNHPGGGVFPGGVASGGGAWGQGLVTTRGKPASLPGLKGFVRGVIIPPDIYNPDKRILIIQQM